MTDVQAPALDLAKKKKKKVVKKDAESETVAAPEPVAEPVEEEAPALELGKKKKKKSTTTATTEGTAETTETSTAPAEGEEPSLDLGKKKKKKKVTVAEEEAVEEEPKEDEEEAGEGQVAWANSDRDYSYEELASRIYKLMHSNNPELGSKQKRYVMNPPQVFKDGTKKSVWANFTEICGVMKRKPDHVLNYVLAELGTNGSVDGSQRLVIKGRFQSKQIENVIKHYIQEYVACRTCRSPDTELKKENRLYFLCCKGCGSSRSVAAIKKGFEAQIGKRKKEAN